MWRVAASEVLPRIPRLDKSEEGETGGDNLIRLSATHGTHTMFQKIGVLMMHYVFSAWGDYV